MAMSNREHAEHAMGMRRIGRASHDLSSCRFIPDKSERAAIEAPTALANASPHLLRRGRETRGFGRDVQMETLT